MPQPPQAESFRAEAADDVTGSIHKPLPDLPHDLGPEDRRRAFAALATALDPQGEGSAVTWENPQTGAKGSFTPVGHAYPTDGKVCRAFIAQVEENDHDTRLQGTACRGRANEWTLSEISPWRKS